MRRLGGLTEIWGIALEMVQLFDFYETWQTSIVLRSPHTPNIF
jgi:hypothetical protein